MIDLLGRIHAIQFGDMVYFHSANGVAGTTYPIGTREVPSNTIADVITICGLLGIDTIMVHGALVLGAAMEHYNFVGPVHWDPADIINLNGQDVDQSAFFRVPITGAQGGTGLIHCIEVLLLSVTGFNGSTLGCSFMTALGFAANATCDIFKSKSHMGSVTFTVGTVTTVNFYEWSGVMALASMTGGTMNIWAAQGAHITIDATCTAGTINIYGNATVVDNSAVGCTVNIYTVDTQIGAVDDIVSGMLVLKQAFNTTTTTINSSVTLFALDALAGPITDIQIEFYLALDAAATFTPNWYATREGAPVTFVVRNIPTLSTIATPAADGRYRYEYGDLPEAGQLEFRLAQDNAGAATVVVDAVLTYKERV